MIEYRARANARQQGARLGGKLVTHATIVNARADGTIMSTLAEQFLLWISAHPRSYGEAMDAWRTSCPRLSIWEDAIADGLVRIERSGDGTMRQAHVSLTAKGRAVLANGETMPAGSSQMPGDAVEPPPRRAPSVARRA
jgi:hypothetical protein